ncbi:SGNH/GDSL hydrolase family protein [Metamycoplasma equirhinis]|uniref:SGNH/GDSL hydrolase family protein n=1 Tax=Metamycoplasma equirhinis TaxID=92402 RepID=UPI0035948C21
MKTLNRKKIFVILGAVVAAPISTAAIAASCKDTKKMKKNEDLPKPDTPTPDKPKPDKPVPEIKKSIETKVSKNLILKDQKIKYLSIGDSISAGFTGWLEEDHHGELKNGKVTGMSFAAYLAYLLNRETPNRLESFKNFATSNATIVEWLDLLGVKYQTKKPNIFDINDSLYKNTFYRFNDIDKLKSDLVNEIKNANLITLSLGANDFLRSFSSILKASGIDKIITSIIEGKNFDLNSFLEYFKNFAKIAQDEISDRLNELFKKLTEINPNANIEIISYPSPVLRFVSSLIEFLPENAKKQLKDANLNSMLVSPLNDAIRDTTKSYENIGYLDVYDAEYWTKNQRHLASIVFDIHPSPLGYKKMAFDAFVKLTNAKIEGKTLQSLGWSNNFILNSESTHYHTVELNSPKVENLYKEFFGANPQEAFNKLLEEDELYKEIKPLLNSDNFAKKILGFPEATMQEIAIALVTKVFTSDYMKQLDPDENLKKFFADNDYAAIKALIKWFKSSNWFIKQFNEAQKLAHETDWDKDGNPGVDFLNKEYIIEIFSKTFLKEENLVELIKEFTKSDFSKDFKDKFANALSNFLKSSLKNEKVKSVISFLAKKTYPSVQKLFTLENYEKFISKILNSSHIPEITKNSILAIFEIGQKSELDKVNNFNDLIKLLLTQEKSSNVIDSIQKMFSELVNDKDIQELLISSSLTFISNEYPTLFSGMVEKDQRIILENFVSVFSQIENELKISKLFLDSLINEIKEHGKDLKLEQTIFSVVKSMSNSLLAEDGKKLLLIVEKFSKNEQLKEHSELVKKFFANILKVFKEQDAATLIWNKLENYISQYVTKENFTKLISSLLEDHKMHEFIFEEIIAFFKSQDFTNQGISKLLKPGGAVYDKFTSVKFVGGLLNNKFFKENKLLFVKIVQDILKNNLGNKDTLAKLLETLGLSKLLGGDENTTDFANLISDLASNKYLEDTLNHIFEIVAESKNVFEDAQNWIEVIAKIFALPNIDKLKTSLKNVIKFVFEKHGHIFGKQVENLLYSSWKSNNKLYKLEVIEKNKGTIANFVADLLNSAINKEETIFSEIINNIFDALKNVKLEKDEKIDHAVKLRNTIILGALKFVQGSAPGKISIEKILAIESESSTENKNKGGKIYKIFDNMNSEYFVKVINLMFEVSNFSLNSGLYATLFGGKYMEPATKHIKDSVSLEKVAEKPKDNPNSSQLKFEIEMPSNPAKLISGVGMVQAIFAPLIKQFILDINKSKYNETDILKVKQLDSYKAIYRIYVTLLMQTFSNIPDDLSVFLPTAFSLMSGSIGRVATLYFEKNQKILEELKQKYGTNAPYVSISKDKDTTLVSHILFSGYTKDQTFTDDDLKNFSNYGVDTILAYVQNPDKNDDKHHKKYGVEVLKDALVNGYLPHEIKK